MSLLHFCNNCAVPSTKEQINLFLTCGHILCKACARPNEKEVCKCVMCNQLSGSRELDKLPEDMKKRLFTSNIGGLFAEPVKVMTFQQQQQNRAYRNYIKYRDGIVKNNKMMERAAAELKQFGAEASKLKARRVKMQDKLTNIYEEQQREQAKHPAQQYRQQQQSMETDSPSTGSTASPENFTFNRHGGFSVGNNSENNFFGSGNSSKHRSSTESSRSSPFTFNIDAKGSKDSGRDSDSSQLFSFGESPKIASKCISEYSSRSPFFA